MEALEGPKKEAEMYVRQESTVLTRLIKGHEQTNNIGIKEERKQSKRCMEDDDWDDLASYE